MGRRHRIHFDGAIYHVYSKGVNGQHIFIDDQDRETFLRILKKNIADASAELIAYCLMGNHYHLAIKVGSIPLSKMMQRILSSYALLFNRRHERTGHLFQARFEAKNCLNERYLRTLIPYIIMNPVRAGLVERPQDWPWSSLLNEPLTDEVLAELAQFDPWENDHDTLNLLRREGLPAKSFEEIAEIISAQTHIACSVLRSRNRRRCVTKAKRLFSQAALKEGHKSTAIARWLNLANSAITRYAQAK